MTQDSFKKALEYSARLAYVKGRDDKSREPSTPPETLESFIQRVQEDVMKFSDIKSHFGT
jgi:hypothetical protein